MPTLDFLSFVLGLVTIFDLTRGECTAGVYEHGVSDEEQQFIVQEHNRLRLQIANGKVEGQPRGINLKRMSWDENLAIQAQNIAETCIFEHVNVKDDRFHVGQNIATSKFPIYQKGANWTDAVLSWWNEHYIYTFGMEFAKGTGHYTQLVWANTEYIGCGYSHFPKQGELKYQKLYVCNYGPGGNLPVDPYKTGDSGCENLC